jgi:hypothetical protein
LPAATRSRQRYAPPASTQLMQPTSWRSYAPATLQRVRRCAERDGSVLADARELLLAGLRELVYQRSLPLATQHLRIVTSRNWARVGVIGASAIVVDHVLSPSAIDALIPS